MWESGLLLSSRIHAIIRPVFSRRPTIVLRRFLSESSRGSFQVQRHLHLFKELKDLCCKGRLTEAVALLCSMELQADRGTYALLLQECIFRKEYDAGKQIHTHMIIVGYVPDEYLKIKLLILYAKSGDLETGCLLFNNLLEKSLVSWNVMIAGFVQKGLEEVGLSFYFKMRQSGLKPDQHTFASVFRACAALASLEQGKRAHGVMVKCMNKENVVVTGALIDMYFKCSSLSDGHHVFDKSVNRNIITWTALVSGYSQHGRVGDVLESFHKMKTEGYRPNYVTFLAVLSACSRGGLVAEGWKHFLEMEQDYRIRPRGQHYAAMVDLLGRAGQLREAYEFVINSPCKEHSVIWGALLGACRIHGDISLMKQAANIYFQLDPENAGKYIVFYNAYVMSGLWNDAEELRLVMKKVGITKEPGYSRIEVQREVFFFSKGDKSHKQLDEIYKVIEELNSTLKDAGYVPELSGN